MTWPQLLELFLFPKIGLTERLVSWFFKHGQPQRIISGLRETFIKEIYIFERTDKAAIGPGEQSERAESCRENLWTEIQLKGP